MADYDEIDNEDEEVEQPKKNWRRELEDRARNAEEERGKLERELAFVKAGVDFSDPKAKYFVKGYEGEVNAEAIKTAWEEGFGATQTEPEIPAEEKAAHQQIASASVSTAPATSGTSAEKLEQWQDRVTRMGVQQLQSPEVYAEFLRDVQAAGVGVGELSHSGVMVPDPEARDMGDLKGKV